MPNGQAPTGESVREAMLQRHSLTRMGGRDIFSKAYAFDLADRLRHLGIYPFFQPFDKSEGAEAILDGKRVLMFGSNNYLGLTVDPRVREAAREAIALYGTSMTGSRLMNGTSKLHQDVEEKIARFLNKEAALVFTTGYQANLGLISALANRNSAVAIDKEDHASIYDGCRFVDGRVVKFRHNDAQHLDKVLSKIAADHSIMVIVDGVFSMSGEIADLPAIAEVTRRHGARLVVDDAHAVGVIGESGRGTASHFGMNGDVDLIVGTFSKSLASIGGFVAGEARVLDYIQHFGRSMLFSASLPPACLAAAGAALDIIEKEPERMVRVLATSRRVSRELTRLGFDVGRTLTPIIPIFVRDEHRTLVLWRELLDEGIFVNPVVAPAVSRNDSLLRTSYMATHTDAMIDRALETFEKVGRRHGLIR
jgi:8-amino-7-oxononanoate synthase